ncbi:MAG: tRNA uridine 5-carboxymethylaminomethyl modification enzyme GidA [Haloplasmataceae bacterium]|jgi:tRNA uridine 5-carboxymethylaminomethyl modification enzyme|nr:tRNA uridine 5-carboxymethylaminomethyl modification enzyme GidA [Haloplasmataceae bacterium]
MYDIIVIGGGHAGCEASLAPARMGLKTLLITSKISRIGHMPCNPSIGGPAKGIVVRELDALGGEMGRNTDKSHIQMRMLNTGKGPAVRALRAQADKVDYPKNMQETLLNQENLTVIEDMVDDLIVEDHQIKGVILENKERIESKAVILTAGTYMKSRVMISSETRISGPDNERPSLGLSDNLRRLGFITLRLKTGTPPRVAIETVDFSKTEPQPGDMECFAFSYDTTEYKPLENQVPCYLTYTNAETHKIIMDNLSKSSMYGAIEKIESRGPRYCPSIEDKIVRFSDKPRHQIFLEPESLHIPEIYVQGLSTSLPRDIQEKIIHTIPGLENCKIVRYAYAIEYDAIEPTQLWPTLESKLVFGLYFAGQVNGTSGYEEAAGQGIMAGINAALKIQKKEPLILHRDEAYIGVMIDDLVTKGTKEPYRLLTSRAEYRLFLRHDNADIRLREYGYKIGLIDEERYKKFNNKVNNIETEKQRLSQVKINPSKSTNEYLDSIESSQLKDGITALNLLKRPEITYHHIIRLLHEEVKLSKEEIEQIEIQVKYEGYLRKTTSQVEKMLKLEEKLIPLDIDYNKILNLAIEAKQKLTLIRPLTIGQAQRISGVNPPDISILLIYLESFYRRRKGVEIDERESACEFIPE